MIVRVQELNDRVKSARFSDLHYINALNEATEEIVNDLLENIKVPEKYTFQSAEAVRTDLSPLINTPAAGALSAGVVPYPADYKYYCILWVTVNGIQVFAKPTTYNKEGEMYSDPFSKPIDPGANTDGEIFYNERGTGLRVLYGATLPSAYELWYVAQPATLSIGNAGNKITTGSGLTLSVLYYAYDQTTYNGVTYYPGDLITGAGLTYTIVGTVIPASVIVNSELTELADKICKRASSIMNADISDFQKMKAIDQEEQRV